MTEASDTRNQDKLDTFSFSFFFIVEEFWITVVKFVNQGSKQSPPHFAVKGLVPVVFVQIVILRLMNQCKEVLYNCILIMWKEAKNDVRG